MHTWCTHTCTYNPDKLYRLGNKEEKKGRTFLLTHTNRHSLSRTAGQPLSASGNVK